MKVFPYVLTALFIGFVVFLWVNDKNMRDTVTGGSSQGAQCYIWNTESGDKATLKIVPGKDTTVTGFLSYRPAQKDSKVGQFSGVRTQQGGVAIVSAQWTVLAEGAVSTEELSLLIEEPIAKIGFGEMKDRGDGVYEYAAPSTIVYSVPLERTDCADPAVEQDDAVATAVVAKDGALKALMSTEWVWEKTVRSDGVVTPKKAGVFTLSFDRNNAVHGTTDCNSFGGTVAIDKDALSFGPFASTLMYCDKAQEGVFTSDLAKVGKFMFNAEGQLVLIFKDGSGAITLNKAK